MCLCLSNYAVFCYEIGALHYVNHTLKVILSIRLYVLPELTTKSKRVILNGLLMSKMIRALFMNHH